MARSVVLNAYTINIRKNRNIEDKEILSSFGEQPEDLLKILNQFFIDGEFLKILEKNRKENSNKIDDTEQKELVNNKDNKRLSIDPSSIKIKERKISGFISFGLTGTEEDIQDEHGERTHIKKVNEAVMTPLYFSILVPETTEGYFIIEQLGVHGLVTILQKSLIEFFKSKFEDYQLIFSKLVNAQAFNALLKEENVLKIEFSQYGLPSDIADTLGKSDYEKNGTTTITFKPSNGTMLSIFGGIKALQSGSVSGYIKTKMQTQINQIKVKVDTGSGKARTIDLSNFQNIDLPFDISDDKDLIWSEKGHPTMDSIEKISDEIINNIISKTLPKSELKEIQKSFFTTE